MVVPAKSDESPPLITLPTEVTPPKETITHSTDSPSVNILPKTKPNDSSTANVIPLLTETDKETSSSETVKP